MNIEQESSNSSLIKNEEAPSQYTRAWAEDGIILESSAAAWHKDDQELIKTLLAPSETDPDFPLYSGDNLLEVLNRVQHRNEARIVRDIQPLFMPSAEKLAITMSTELESKLIEEVKQSWIRAKAIRGSTPQSDFMVGFRAGSFTELELQKMRNISTLRRPTSVTDSLYYPFAICKAKSSDKLEEAGLQNAHAAAVVMRSLVGLYRTSDLAISELHERICVFSVSHDHSRARIYAHYPRVRDNYVTWHRALIAGSNLELQDPRERWKSYNIFHKVYTIFGPKALERITKALAKQPAPDMVVASSPVSTDFGSDVATMGSPPKSDLRGKRLKEMQKQLELERQQPQDKIVSTELEGQRERQQLQDELTSTELERQRERQQIRGR